MMMMMYSRLHAGDTNIRSFFDTSILRYFTFTNTYIQTYIQYDNTKTVTAKYNTIINIQIGWILHNLFPSFVFSPYSRDNDKKSWFRICLDNYIHVFNQLIVITKFGFTILHLACHLRILVLHCILQTRHRHR